MSNRTEVHMCSVSDKSGPLVIKCDTFVIRTIEKDALFSK
jgi:hypothetical protein